MTMTIEEKRRELFEEFAVRQCLSLTCSKEALMFANGRRVLAGGYILHETARAWEAFNAALDAVVIELPKLWISNESCASEQAACQTLNACKQAIESTGLGLKVKS